MQFISYEAQTTDVFNLSGIVLFVNIALLTKNQNGYFFPYHS